MSEATTSVSCPIAEKKTGGDKVKIEIKDSMTKQTNYYQNSLNYDKSVRNAAEYIMNNYRKFEEEKN